jgi:hypothetical protein
MDLPSTPESTSIYELVFAALHRGSNFSFPCDAQGVVDMNALSDRARHNYLLARALVGSEFSVPQILRTDASSA